MNATATMPGTFAYSPAAGTVLAAGGTATLTVTFTRDDATRYILATASQSLVVAAPPPPPVLAWVAPAQIAARTTPTSSRGPRGRR